MSVTRYQEIPSGAVNNVNKTFIAAHAPDAGSLVVLDDGVEAAVELLNGATITLSAAPATGSILTAIYNYTTADNVDLSTLAAVKAWAEVKTTDDDAKIQQCLTAFSQYVLQQTGRASLNSVASLTELYDGNSNVRLLLRNYPIVALTAVKINNAAQVISSGYGAAGISVHSDLKSILFAFGAAGYFSEGMQNIQVAYQAGYAATPHDLEMAVCEAVATNYKRRQWMDLKSKSQSVQGAVGTTTYRDWKLSPYVESILTAYTRQYMCP